MLKHPGWVVFPCNPAHILDVLLAIAAQRILRAISIIEVDIFVVGPNGPGVCLHLLQCRGCQILEQCIVCFVVPRVIKEHLWDVVSFSSWVSVQSKNSRKRFSSKRSSPRTFPPRFALCSENNFGHGCSMVTMLHCWLLTWLLASSRSWLCTVTACRSASFLFT